MGCDIHLFTEKKQTVNGVQRWVNIDNWRLNPYFGGDDEPEYEIKECYRGRNYTLFSMLADVRNQHKNNVISQPKGIPKDVSDIIKSKVDKYGSDGHSHSYLTMKELYDFYEKNPTEKHEGLTDNESIELIKSGKMPKWWCQSSSQDNLTYIKWEYKNQALSGFIESLERHFEFECYDKERDSEDFRIVFFFDN